MILELRVLIIFLLFFLKDIYCFSKVIVPSIYHEFINGYPKWIVDKNLQKKYNYSVVLYQKINSSDSNYIKFNRGTEGGVYLRYIVDNYFNLPDVMLFTHAHPNDHQPYWLQFLSCVKPSINYLNINFLYLYRYSTYWKNDIEFWLEQCMRDILKIVWGLEDNLEEFNKRLSPTKPIFIAASCCNQFFVNKETILKRPISTYKKLLKIINEQQVCHEGPLDFQNLYAWKRTGMNNTKPEPIDMPFEVKGKGYGREIQGVAMEHLAHVIFGSQDLNGYFPVQTDFCNWFDSICFKSPCGNDELNPPKFIKIQGYP